MQEQTAYTNRSRWYNCQTTSRASVLPLGCIRMDSFWPGTTVLVKTHGLSWTLLKVCKKVTLPSITLRPKGWQKKAKKLANMQCLMLENWDLLLLQVMQFIPANGHLRQLGYIGYKKRLSEDLLLSPVTKNQLLENIMSTSWQCIW